MSFISLQPTCFVAIKCSGEVRRQRHHARPGDSEEQDRARKDPERLDPQQREGQSRVHHSVPLQVVQLLSTTKFRPGVNFINKFAHYAKAPTNIK